MLAPMKKRHINEKKKLSHNMIVFWHAGVIYKIPKKIAEKYTDKQCEDHDFISADKVFSGINQKYTKPGALLKGLRARENLTQIELANQLQVTQSDISQMENGIRLIGRTIARRIEKLFDVDYRSFLS